MENRKFFNKSISKVNADFNNAGGSLANQRFDPPGYKVQADGGVGARKPMSDPYKLTLTNASTSIDFTNVVLLNAGEQNGEGGNNYGLDAIATAQDGVANDLVIAYNVPDVTLVQFYNSMLTSNTLIGKTIIASSDTDNLTSSLKVEDYNVTGGVNSQAHSPEIDPYQQQGTRIVWEQEFAWNLFTKLTVASITADTKINYSFYPIANHLAQKTSEYADPQIIRQR